ncbi:MAG: toprim domain-containing protein [Rickettsiales bacterium]|nr:toprim domain-containing protein [Rickettsiales bacterium]
MDSAGYRTNGTKRFYPGGRRKGCFHTVGSLASPPPAKLEAGSSTTIYGASPSLTICEGFATGASIHEATGRTVIVAGDTGNLLSVAKALRGKYPSRELIFATDNDTRVDSSSKVISKESTKITNKKI